jgi:chromosomal replication initiator protein
MKESVENQEAPGPVTPEMQSAWEKASSMIEKSTRPQYFQTFMPRIKLVGSRGQTLLLGFSDKFLRNWVYDHFSNHIQEIFDEASQARYKLEFVVAPDLFTTETAKPRTSVTVEEMAKRSVLNAPGIKAPALKAPTGTSQLNPKYGFETFVVGASNQFAHAACFAAAEAPGRQYNPLFIYGDVGLGKTHLMNAIGLKIQEKFPGSRVHYTTFEKFTNHMIESIRFGRMEEFRERYRKNCDVLVIDDIQFISGKERVQEEFFHTFNSLYEHQKQIVLSSDRPPTQIEGLEDRLRSRFEMGLIVDIKAPEMETRVAIVIKKAEMDGIDISNDVAFFLARMFRANIRELEGALIKLSAYASLTGSEINLDLCKKVLQHDLPDIDGGFQRDPEEILRLVAKEFQISVADLKSERKNRQLAVPRQLAMYLCRKYTHLSLPDIGTLFGGKNHTTVLHAIRKIDKTKSSEPMLKDGLHRLEAFFQQV